MHIELKNIKKYFDDVGIFEDLNLDFSNCGVYFISGNSGSGKTTLLNILAGYESFNEGKRIVEKEITMACIFQSYELIEELTIKDNIFMSSDFFDEDSSKKLDMIDTLGIKEVLDHYPSELSQGQKQRVGIARALLCNPQVIICDEPTESLDIENKDVVLSILKELSKDKVIIIACHDDSSMKDLYDYHYHIENKKLTLVQQKREHTRIQITNIEKVVNTFQVTRYIHKIIHSKTVIQTILMTTLILFQIMMFQIDVQLFASIESREALNGNIIYVKANGMPNGYLEKYGSSKPIPSFLPLAFNGRNYKVNIYPQEQNDHFSKVEMLKDKEVLINQNLFMILQDTLGVDEKTILNKTLRLSYQVTKIDYSIDFVIAGVIEESDVTTMQIYYSYDGMMQILKEQPGFEEWPSQYEYLQDNSLMYEVICQQDTLENTFENMIKDANITSYHSVLSSRNQNQGQDSMYHILFILMQILVCLFTILYYVSKDVTKNRFSLSIIHALGISIAFVKKSFFKEKCKYLWGTIGCVFMEVIVVSFLMELKLWHYLVIFGYTAFCVGLSIIVLTYRLYTFNASTISLILKENKDM